MFEKEHDLKDTLPGLEKIRKAIVEKKEKEKKS